MTSASALKRGGATVSDGALTQFMNSICARERSLDCPPLSRYARALLLGARLRRMGGWAEAPSAPVGARLPAFLPQQV